MKKKKNCYQLLAEAIQGNPGMNFSADTFPGFESRGHSAAEFTAWQKILKWVLSVVRNSEGSLNDKKEYCRQTVSSVLDYIPKYRLRENELIAIAHAEEIGRGPLGLVYKDDALGRDVVSYDYREIPYHSGGRKDIFVIFSGHPESAVKAVEGFYRYVKVHKALPDGIVFLGLQDNQGMTDFRKEFVFRKSSEYRQYLRQCLALGLPQGLLRKLLMTPRDTSTEENFELLQETLEHYGVTGEVNLVNFTYPVYQSRVAAEEKFFSDAHNLPWWVVTADIPCKKVFSPILDSYSARASQGIRMLEDERVFSYDRTDDQLADLAIGNCIAHLYRGWGEQRVRLPHIGYEYPQELRALLPLFLAYSYPNVAHELCGVDEEVAEVLKIVRHLMLDEYDEGNTPVTWEKQVQLSTLVNGYKFVADGLISAELIHHGKWMDEDKWLEAFLKFQK